MRRPVDFFGIALLTAATGGIAANALYLQHGSHPAPILVTLVKPSAPTETTGSLVASPRPRPTEAESPPKDANVPSRPRAQIIADIQRELAQRGFYEGAVDGIYGPKMDAGIREFEQAAGLKSTGDPTELLLRAIAGSPVRAAPRATTPAGAAPRRAETPAAGSVLPMRVAAVQRALTDFGYGQIKPTGVFDGGTKAAIEKFERDRKLPVTGQISDRLARELAAVTGRPLE